MTTHRSTAKTVSLVLGSLATLLGVCLGIGGGALVWAHSSQRDSAGFYSTSAERLETASFGITSDRVDLGADAASYRWVPESDSTVVRLQATASNDRPLFVGIARSADVANYLAGTAHAVVTDFDVDPFRVEVRESGGTARPARPADQAFWAASATGPGTQTVNWTAQPGNWTVVMMNADGTPGVSADVAVGAKTGALLPIGLGVLGFAALVAAGGVALIVAGSNRRPARSGRPPTPPVPSPDRPAVPVS